jgi:hypothetical protein
MLPVPLNFWKMTSSMRAGRSRAEATVTERAALDVAAAQERGALQSVGVTAGKDSRGRGMVCQTRDGIEERRRRRARKLDEALGFFLRTISALNAAPRARRTSS